MGGGQVETEFLRSLGQFSGLVRGIALAVLSVFGVLSTPTAALPLAFALLGLALVSGVADCHHALTGRGGALACVLTVARAAAIIATQPWTVPGLWAPNVLTITGITMQWQWPPRVTVPVLTGLLALEAAVIGVADAAPTLFRVVLESTLAWLAFALLVRVTRWIERVRDRQAALERAETLALERRRQEREYLALLHDTASATFLMVALHDAEPEAVAGYARRDLALLTGETGGPAAHDSLVDLDAALRGVLAQSALRVDLAWTPVPLLPASVALAATRAVREALVNVERHAGVTEARVAVAPHRHGAVVTVRDEGAGFEPEAVPGHRRGIRGSLVERMAAAGGSATVTSRPGAGTTVRLVWPDD
ncbi:sensor histidine kinase [Amycolatopsis tucumanensis]|uniref:sensor histidine kinase n=1 Tax=Amycolatopsis tucumanensis TaxID=401106 RepID=UPI003D7207AD